MDPLWRAVAVGPSSLVADSYGCKDRKDRKDSIDRKDRKKRKAFSSSFDAQFDTLQMISGIVYVSYHDNRSNRKRVSLDRSGLA